MEIDLYQIISQANLFANTMLMEQLKKDGNFSVHTLSSLKANSVLQTEYGYEFTMNLIVGAITEYHEQLRSIIKEKMDIELDGIDLK